MKEIRSRCKSLGFATLARYRRGDDNSLEVPVVEANRWTMALTLCPMPSGPLGKYKVTDFSQRKCQCKAEKRRPWYPGRSGGGVPVNRNCHCQWLLQISQ